LWTTLFYCTSPVQFLFYPSPGYLPWRSSRIFRAWSAVQFWFFSSISATLHWKSEFCFSICLQWIFCKFSKNFANFCAKKNVLKKSAPNFYDRIPNPFHYKFINKKFQQSANLWIIKHLHKNLLTFQPRIPFNAQNCNLLSLRCLSPNSNLHFLLFLLHTPSWKSSTVGLCSILVRGNAGPYLDYWIHGKFCFFVMLLTSYTF
jgi:hypothetical protein